MIRECRLFELRARDLAELVVGQIVAIHIRGGFPAVVAQSILRAIDDVTAQNYRYANPAGKMMMSNTRCIGAPFNELYATFNTPQHQRAMEEYTEKGRTIRQQLREACGERSLPLDSLRAVLDEIWPWGAQLLAVKGVKCNPGIIRVMVPEEYGDCEEPPHMDRIPPYVENFESQLSAIAYLRMPAAGGELELWALNSQNLTTLADSRGQFRNICGSGMLLRPNVGDIVIINTGAPHAVRSFSGGSRVVQNVFIGFSNDNPLQFWA